MPIQSKHKIIIIEPSPVVQQGLKMLLESNSDFQVIQTFSDYHVFGEKRIDEAFHIVLINPAMINYHKQFIAKNLFLAYPDILVVAIVYNYVDAETLSSFDGVLDIYDDGTQLVKKLTKFVEISQNQETKANIDNIDLSDREKEILISVAIGLTNKEIAEKHHISIHTVISHRKNISRKVGIKTVSGLTIYAIFNNLISEEDL